MRLSGLAALSALLVAVPAWAQEDDVEAALKAADEASKPAEAEAAPAEGAPAEGTPGEAAAPADIGSEDQMANFVLERGFYFSSDVGAFFTVGGTKGFSNVQPFLSAKVGFDINDFLSVQVALAHGYSSGNPLSNAELQQNGGQGTLNYSLLNMGAELVLAVRPTQRFALDIKAGGGLSRMYPQLTDPNNPSATLGGTAPYATAGLEFMYLTLLTDFTAGIAATGYYVIGPGIVGLGISPVVRYTF